MADILSFPSSGPTPITPSAWVEACRIFEGRPISFEQQPYIIDVIDCPVPWQVLKTARQVAKSTTLVNLMLAWGCNAPWMRMLYVAPTHAQMLFFSEERLRPAIHDSPNIKDHFFDYRTCFDRQNYRSLTTPAFIHLTHCYLSADSARGLSAHALLLDETQGLLRDVVPVLEQIVSASRRSEAIAGMGMADLRRYSGTPKTFDTVLERYWDLSTQNEWLVPCSHCGGGDYRRWNLLDEESIGREGLLCKHCGEDIHWPDGQWVSRYPERSWTGWHISQLMATEPLGWIPWETIRINQLNYPPEQFYNEVLGLAYDHGDRPITQEALQRCCTPEFMCGDASQAIPGSLETFAGFDWGFSDDSMTSFSVFVIYALVQGRFQLQHVKRFRGIEAADPNYILEYVKSHMERYHVRLLGLDRGVGHMENLRLKSDLNVEGDLSIIEYAYTSQADEVKWNEKTGAVHLDRTSRMERVFEAMRQGWMWFPKWDFFEDEYANDILTIYSDYNAELRKMRYLNREPDDFFHATLFAWECFMYWNPGFTNKAFAPTIGGGGTFTT